MSEQLDRIEAMLEEMMPFVAHHRRHVDYERGKWLWSNIMRLCWLAIEANGKYEHVFNDYDWKCYCEYADGRHNIALIPMDEHGNVRPFPHQEGES